MDNSTLNLNITETFTNSTPPFTDLMMLVIICISSINILVGLPIHSYVIWLIAGRGHSIASEFFSLNLSLCEIGFCLNSCLDILVIWFSSLQGLDNFIKGLITTGRPLIQCLICVERYLAVVHPVTFLKFKPLRYKVICCTAAWIITLGSCLCCLYLYGLSTIDIFMYFFFVQFLIFLFIQMFCCVAVLRALKQSGPGERGREREEENHMKRRAFYLILITTVNIAIIYLPFCISNFIDIFLHLHFMSVWFVCYVCYVLTGFVHPILFLHRVGKLSCLCSL